MLSITSFKCEYLSNNCVTDNLNPRFSFALESDKNNTHFKKGIIKIDSWEKVFFKHETIVYDGPELTPFTKYQVQLEVEDSNNEVASTTLTFETGFLSTSWKAKWITDGKYIFKEKKISPIPMVFKKSISISKKVKSCKIYSTALGIYDLFIDGKKIGNRYFAPGFTSYKSQLQYQTYDITNLINNNFTINAIVAGGWAIGSFVFTRKNRITAPRQALLLEIHIEYEDGTIETISTDESWKVSTEGMVKMADFYDGEYYDANVNFENINYHQCSLETIKIKPKIIAEYGSPVIPHEHINPISMKIKDDLIIYDFGQNFAGVVNLEIINAEKNQIIEIKHAEVLNSDGTPNTNLLRSAKATLTYICREGNQYYSPTFTYMGFRYISIKGIKEDQIKVSANAIYSDIDEIGHFECSNELINKLQSNIVWSAKSNFVDIPTDCPQRDERMGWTGDINVFAPTACFNFDMSRFLEKWLIDLKSEQLKTGGIPSTIPVQGYGFPATMPVMAIDFWGDACINVPYQIYQSTGNISILETMYETMKKYVKACLFWSNFLSVGKNRYIWNTLPVFHFGDWVAPDVPKMTQWQSRAKWTATASLKNSATVLSQIAKILGKNKDFELYQDISNKVSNAYVEVLTDGKGKLYNEFQTGYVLPLYFKMFKDEEQRKNAVNNLVKLIEKNSYCIGTGFPGTPYILFALTDNGREDVAMKMLLNTSCPSWLYEVKTGGTTIWERWDGLKEDGTINLNEDGTGGMISFNHYASGAVGNFLYQKIGGLVPLKEGYSSFQISPLMNSSITWSKCSTITPYGKVSVEWKLENGKYIVDVKVPVGCNANVILPNNEIQNIESGNYHFERTIKEEIK